MTISSLYPNIRPSLLTHFSKSQVIDPRLTFTRASLATYVDATGSVREAVANQPRFQFDATTGECLGLMMEDVATNRNTNPRAEGSTNGLLLSPGALPTGWAISAPLYNSTLSSEIIGTTVINGVTCLLLRFFGVPPTTGALIIRPGGNETGIAVGTTVVQSVYIQLYAGTTTNVTGWQLRCANEASATSFSLPSSLTMITNTRVLAGTTSNTSIRLNFIDTVTSVDITIAIGLPHREHADYLSSPILPPVGTIAMSTRAADVLSSTDVSSWMDVTQGTWIIESATRGVGVQPIMSMDDNTANQQIIVYTQGTDPKFTITDGGVTQADLDAGATSAAVPFKMGATYNTNKFTTCVDGGTVQADVSGSVPLVDRIRIGSDQAGNQLVGNISRMAYYSEAVTDAQLVELTK